MKLVIVTCSGAEALGASIAGELNVTHVKAETEFYPDDTISVIIGDRGAEAIAGAAVALVQSCYPGPPTRLYELLLTADLVMRSGAARLLDVIPYLPFARSDRAPISESLAMAVVARLLASGGMEQMLTVDIHSERAAGYLGSGLRQVPHHVVFEPLVRNGILTTLDADLVAAPDAGSALRAQLMATLLGIEYLSCIKKRVAGSRAVTISVPSHFTLEGRRVLIVDDAAVTGATLSAAAAAIAAEGGRVVGVLVTHWHPTALPGWRLPGKLITSDSLETPAGRMRSVSLAPLLADAVKTWKTSLVDSCLMEPVHAAHD